MKAFPILFSFLIFIFFSCNEHESEITSVQTHSSLTKTKLGDEEEPCDVASLKEQQNEILSTIFGQSQISVDSNLYSPMAQECVYIQHVVVTHHYEPKSGKILGIWPETGSSQNTWSEYRTKWGFSQIILTGIAYGVSAGFNSTDIMLPIPNYSSYQNFILSEDSPMYYIDEPIERGTYSVNQLIEVANFISVHRSNAKLYLGSWQYKKYPYLTPRSEYLNVINQTGNTFIMCDQYDGDQRNIWTGFRNSVGNRNLSDWIHSRRDEINEFSQLIGHANNIGINSLWFFLGDDGTPGNISYFCDKAWANGWLRKWVQDVKIEYKCSLPDPCDCNPNCFPNNYYISNIEYGSITEIFP